MASCKSQKNNTVLFIHWRLPSGDVISNFIILEVKTSEKGGYSVTFSIRQTCVFSCSTLNTVYNRVRQRLFGFTSGQLGWTSGHERWAHFLKILLSRNELITQALHLSFSIITNGMKKSWKMVVLVIIFTDFCVVFLDFVLLFDIFHLFIDSAFRLICSLPLSLSYH